MEYQHGGDIYSQDIQMDYSANINPSWHAGGGQAGSEGLPGEGSLQPVPGQPVQKLRQALGRHHGVEEQWIICGNGAADLIFGLAAALRPCARAGDSPGLFRV
ncbi:MAG: hypothetical protein ACLR0U_19610 [Enterocloster clostridioformis]